MHTLVGKPVGFIRQQLLYITDREKYILQKNIRKKNRALGKKAVIDYVPPHVAIYISFRCNFRCPGCTFLLNDPKSFNEGGFMQFDVYGNILYKFRGKAATLALGGGEPTLHPKFSDMVMLASKLGYRIQMSTNGSYIPNIAGVLSYFDKINVSIDSYDYESFKRNRGVSRKAYGRILEGLSLMSDKRIPFNMSYLLTRERLDGAVKFIDFARNYKPVLLNFHAINPHGDGSIQTLKWEYPEVKSFYRQLLSLRDLPFDVRLPYPFPTDERLFEKAICPKIWDGVYIHENGDIAYCCHLKPDPTIGNIFDGYDFNSPKMVGFRRAMIGKGYKVPDCSLCQRRFDLMDKPYYSRDRNRWIVIPEFMRKSV